MQTSLTEKCLYKTFEKTDLLKTTILLYVCERNRPVFGDQVVLSKEGSHILQGLVPLISPDL